MSNLHSPIVPVNSGFDPRRILVAVVDADVGEGEQLCEALAEHGYQTTHVTGAEEAVELFGCTPIDVVIADTVANACLFVEEAKKADPEPKIVVLTERSCLEEAVQAMAKGVLGYLSKPIHASEVEAVVRRAVERKRLEDTARELTVRLDSRYGFGAVIGQAPAMQRVFDVVQQAAPTNASVLLLGESGTGKELVAKILHQNSPRSAFPFVALNCAALSDTILESELFGHEKGAFTGAIGQRKGRFEYATRGTLFLDEVGDMPMSTQIKLLRVLEEREVVRVGSNQPIKIDVRLIAATNADLEQKVDDGSFRNDLYYRLRVVTIRLPALRERPTDIPLLIDHFLRRFAEQNTKAISAVTPAVRQVLSSYAWPGNVRELRNAVEHMVVVANTPVLDVECLPDYLRAPEHSERRLDGLAGFSLEGLERELIRNTLELTGGNREAAAKTLKIGERTLYRKIKKYGLS